MTLLFDRRPELSGQPGIHAFIVGVSAYPHLAGGTGPPARDTFGLGQAPSSSVTAYSIYEWLLNAKDSLRVPLATCSLLVAPSREELDASPGLQRLTAPNSHPTLDMFLNAAYQWRDFAGTNRDNLALFYFAGHSLQVARGEGILLLPAFGDGRGGLLYNSVTTGNLFYGMAPSGTNQEMARMQLYFVDAPAKNASDLTYLHTASSTQVFEVELSSMEDRSAPVFYGALWKSEPGSPVAPSGFSRLLLDCLEGGAGVESSPDRWAVTVLSLASALGDRVSAWNEENPTNLQLSVGGAVRDGIIRYLDGPPKVNVTLTVEPDNVHMRVHLRVFDEDDNLVVDVPPPLMPYPYNMRLAGGAYRIAVLPEPPAPDLVPYKKLAVVRPPSQNLRVRLRK